MNFSLNRNQKIFLAILLSASFFISISYSFYFRIDPSVDARAYDAIGWNLAQGHGYRESVEIPISEDNSIVRVGPGYEFFLAIIYFIFGHSLEAVWVAQAALLSLSALLVFLLAREVFSGISGSDSEWTFLSGMTGAAIIGFSPDLITLQGMIMTETLGVFLISLTAYLFFRCINGENYGILRVISVAAGVAAATMVRTPAAFLFFPIAAYFIFEKKRKEIFVFVVALLIFFSPWTIRNYLIYNSFIPTNLAYGIDLAAGNHPGATGELEPYDLNDQLIAEYGYLKANSLLAKKTFDFIISNPLEFAKITLNRLSIYFSFARPTGFWFHLQGIERALTVAFSSIYSALLFILGFWGAFQIRHFAGIERKKSAYLFALLLMMPLAIIGIIVETRYRFLSYPFFAVFAGLAVQSLKNNKLELRPQLYIAVILFANTFFDISRNWGRILERFKEFIQ